MSIEAGRLRHRVRIEQSVLVVDSNGDAVQDPKTGETTSEWIEVATVWAAIEPISGREFIQSQAKQSQITARIVIRFREGVTAAMRLVHVRRNMADVVYNIHALLADKDSGLEYITMPVSTGVSTSGQ
jgi:SPP1 family predicted phage head-tail adaptor